jgi:hypothetical protein
MYLVIKAPTSFKEENDSDITVLSHSIERLRHEVVDGEMVTIHPALDNDLQSATVGVVWSYYSVTMNRKVSGGGEHNTRLLTHMRDSLYLCPFRRHMDYITDDAWLMGHWTAVSSGNFLPEVLQSGSAVRYEDGCWPGVSPRPWSMRKWNCVCSLRAQAEGSCRHHNEPKTQGKKGFAENAKRKIADFVHHASQSHRTNL